MMMPFVVVTIDDQVAETYGVVDGEALVIGRVLVLMEAQWRKEWLCAWMREPADLQAELTEAELRRILAEATERMKPSAGAGVDDERGS